MKFKDVKPIITNLVTMDILKIDDLLVTHCELIAFKINHKNEIAVTDILNASNVEYKTYLNSGSINPFDKILIIGLN